MSCHVGVILLVFIFAEDAQFTFFYTSDSCVLDGIYKQFWA